MGSSGTSEAMPPRSAIESMSPPSPVQNPAAIIAIIATKSPKPRRSARQIHEFARQRPELQMSPDTNTASDVLEEWYESIGDISSIVGRDRLYKAIWRRNPSFYKKRVVIIK